MNKTFRVRHSNKNFHAAEDGAQMRAIFDAITDGIFVADAATGRFIDVNEFGCRMFGYRRNELIGAPVAVLTAGIPPYTEDAAVKRIQRLRLRGPQLFEWHAKTKSGAPLWIEISLKLTEYGGRDVLLAAVRDVTERKSAQETLRVSQARYRALVETTPDWVWEMDEQLRFTFVSPQSERLLGYPPDQVIGHSALEYMTEEDAKRTVAETADLIENRRPMHEYIATFVHKSGRRVIVETNAVPFYDADGRYQGYRGVDRDITERTQIDKKIREDEAKFRSLIEQNVAGVAIMRDDGTVAYVNPYFARMMGYGVSEVIGRPLLDFVPEAERAIVAEKLSSHLTGKGGFVQLVSAMQAKGGHIIDVIVNASPTIYDGRPASLGVVIDITEQRSAQRKLTDSESKLATIVGSVQAGILIIDPEKHVIVDVNPAAAKMIGAPREAIVGASCQIYVCPADIGKCPITDLHQEVDNSERILLTAHGASVPILKTVAKVTLAGKAYLIESFVDISERKRAEAELTHMTRSDALTGLNNRRVFVEALEQAVTAARRDDKRFAVLYLDLDHFKDINDALGHPIGDLLLREIAQRLKTRVRKGDTVARFGGDEFALLANALTDPMDAADLAESILNLLGAPCTVQDKQIRIGGSIGIAYCDKDTPPAEVILSQADMALYKSKNEGRGTYRFFTAAMDAEVRDRVILGAELREAIASDQLFLLYQPQVDIDTGRIIGLEALVRWRHPTRGVVSPDRFIPITEHIGLIVPLGRWVVQNACRQMRAWRDAGIAPPLVAVNISAMQFTTPLELERDIAAILAEAGLRPENLELELTETVLMTVSREHNEELARLHKSGLRIAIDDFGTGYSSLAYLSRLPVDRIKIAQSFIRDLTATSANAAIVRAAIGVAHELGLDVVVEGVETAEELELVKSWDAHKVQGFYFAKPLTADEIALLLAAGSICPDGDRITLNRVTV